MEGSGDDQHRGVLLSLRFAPVSDDEPRPEEIASVLEDIEGLYRAVPAAAALGVPVADLLSDYRAVRADAAIESWTLAPSDMKRLRRSMAFPEFEELFFYLASQARRRGWDRPYVLRSLLVPEHAMRVRRLAMGSPFDVVTFIPAAYCVGFALTRFLRALETYFNMPERIRTERVDLEAKQAEGKADMAEAELREQRAALELAGLRGEEGTFRLVNGEVRPDENDDEGNRSDG